MKAMAHRLIVAIRARIPVPLAPKSWLVGICTVSPPKLMSSVVSFKLVTVLIIGGFC